MSHPIASSLSLIIPTFNRGDLIGETIASALAQTVPFLEIIVVDDGSTDDTPTVLAKFGDRVTVLRQQNGGVQLARNLGVSHARGEFIVLCDSDDLLQPNYNERVLEALRLRPETDALYCNFCTFTGNDIHQDKFSQAPAGLFDGAEGTGEFIWNVPDLYLRTLAFQPLFMTGCLVRRAFYEKLRGFNAAFLNLGAEDWEFTLRCLAQGQVTLALEPLVRVRKHANNESTDSIRQVRGTADILEYALTGHPEAAQYREQIISSIDERRLSVFHVSFSHGKFDIAEEMLTLLKRKPSDTTFRLKRAILGMPAWLRTPLWKLTQQSSAQ